MAVFKQKNHFLTENPNLLNKKPIGAIEVLFSHFLPLSKEVATKNKQEINYSSNKIRKCFLLHAGNVSLNRSIDGMMLNSESAPFVFGLSTQLTDHDYLFIRSHETSKISWLPLEVANQCIAENNLWRPLTELLIYNVTRIYDHCTKISSLSSYDIIRYQLYELMSEPEAIRLSITIANYVQSRTFLSRSTIMKILAQLKSGGYIITNKGLLLTINQIPLKY